MGEQLATDGRSAWTAPVDPAWRRQWFAQTAALVPLSLLTAFALGGGSSGSGGWITDDLGTTLHWLVLPLLVWAAAMGGVAYLLRRRSAAARCGWSAVVGTALAVLLPVVGGGVLVVLVAALLACCQIGYAAVARHLETWRRIGFAASGAAAAIAGAAAARMGFGAIVSSGDGGSGRTGYGVISALILVALIAAIGFSFAAGRKGWAALAIVGLVLSGVTMGIATPHDGASSGNRGGFDPATVPDDFAECSFDASRPGCGG